MTFCTPASVSISIIAKARGRSEGGGNLSLSLHPSHLPLSSRSSALWGGTRPLIIPFIAHRGPKEGCKRTRKRRPLALALPLLHRVPTSAPQTATALNAPSSMKQSNPPVADGSLIPRYRETFLSSSFFDRASVSLRA